MTATGQGADAPIDAAGVETQAAPPVVPPLSPKAYRATTIFGRCVAATGAVFLFLTYKQASVWTCATSVFLIFMGGWMADRTPLVSFGQFVTGALGAWRGKRE